MNAFFCYRPESSVSKSLIHFNDDLQLGSFFNRSRQLMEHQFQGQFLINASGGVTQAIFFHSVY